MKRFNCFSKMMHVDGRIYPSSERPLTLHAVFKDGSVAVGESKLHWIARRLTMCL